METDPIHPHNKLWGILGSSYKETKQIGEERPLAERSNMVFMNTHVTRGQARGIVVATSAETEVGQIAEAAQEEEEMEAPFTQEVQATAKKISYLALSLIVVSSLVFGFYGKNIYQILMLSGALITGAIPAALPVTVTYSLTNAMNKMADYNVLVKNLPLLETLGGVDVICTDKTGTLTQNKMALKKFFVPGENPVQEAEEMDQEQHQDLARSALAANEAQEVAEGEELTGEPEDIGLINYFAPDDETSSDLLEDFEQTDFLPFSSDRKMAQALMSRGGTTIRYTKGAPEVIIDRCDQILVDGDSQQMTDEWAEKIRNSLEDFSNQALRTLAFSYKENAEQGVGEDTGNEVFLGLVGMWDPPKEEVKDAVQTCYHAGIDVKMITGDREETAVAIAEECGFEDINAISWEDVKDADEDEMEQIVQQHNVFARMDPELKMSMVKALHRLGQRVAITGDGVNDTPSIQAAEVGVAMGDRGSDITRDAADLILLDDNFASIEQAIKYGRTSLSNVRKVANYLMTANLFEVVTLFISSLLGFTPFRAIQVLWVNFATDIFPAMGLGNDRPHPDIMEKQPTGEEESILTKRVWYLLTGIGLKKVMIVFATFFFILWLSKGNGNILGIKGNLILAQTAVFVWLGLSHIVRILAIRWNEGWTGSKIFINKFLNYSLLWPLVAFIIILYTPLASFFRTIPMPLWGWGIVAATLSVALGLAIAISNGVDYLLGERGATEY